MNELLYLPVKLLQRRTNDGMCNDDVFLLSSYPPRPVKRTGQHQCWNFRAQNTQTRMDECVRDSNEQLTTPRMTPYFLREAWRATRRGGRSVSFESFPDVGS